MLLISEALYGRCNFYFTLFQWDADEFGTSNQCSKAYTCFDTLNFVSFQRDDYTTFCFGFSPNFVIPRREFCTDIAAISDMAN